MTEVNGNRSRNFVRSAEPGKATARVKIRVPVVSTCDFEQLPSVLTSREAANVLRVGVREVRTLVDSGQLAGTRLGPRKVIRISRSALLALMRVQSAG